MSIYAVRLAHWYPPGDEHHGIMKFLVKIGRCDGTEGCPNCKKKNMHWQKAYGHHSIVVGYGDIWCSGKCFDNWCRKRRKK